MSPLGKLLGSTDDEAKHRFNPRKMAEVEVWKFVAAVAVGVCVGVVVGICVGVVVGTKL
jgi:MFS superfamily sulfate permease-like transporter